MIAGRIAYMGGTPRVTFETILTNDDSRKMLGQDLQGEQEAIRRYKERILQAMSLGEFGLADVLKEILEDEEEHEDDLITSLGVDTAAGEDPGILSEGPGGAASYISEDPQVKELQDLREKRKEVIIQKLASLKKS
jgi:rubrerythrin